VASGLHGAGGQPPVKRFAIVLRQLAITSAVSPSVRSSVAGPLNGRATTQQAIHTALQRGTVVRGQSLHTWVENPLWVEKSIECDGVKTVIASHRTVSLAKALVSQTEESDYEFTISAQRYLVREGGIWRPFVRVSGNASCTIFGYFRSDNGAPARRALLTADRPH
jgi:hypothetical protein